MHAAWLAPALMDGTKAAELCRSAAPIEELEHYSVSTTVNNVRAEGEELIGKIELECVIADCGRGGIQSVLKPVQKLPVTPQKQALFENENLEISCISNQVCRMRR